MAHYVYSENMIGNPVAHKFTKRIRHDVWQVRMDTIVWSHEHDWRMVDSTFYPLDTNDGRRRLAQYCVAPDMLVEQK